MSCLDSFCDKYNEGMTPMRTNMDLTILLHELAS